MEALQAAKNFYYYSYSAFNILVFDFAFQVFVGVLFFHNGIFDLFFIMAL